MSIEGSVHSYSCLFDRSLRMGDRTGNPKTVLLFSVNFVYALLLFPPFRFPLQFPV